MNIESHVFDAKSYVLSMLKENSIKNLMRKNNQIEEEIKVHDHQIQSLVFQNYSKFISSIDTVRQMKNNICMVDDKLKVLDQCMDSISQLAVKIDSTFSVKRKQIQKLDTINKDLQKLKNLCDFPNILKTDLDAWRSIPKAKIYTEIDSLFTKSVAAYSASYPTLEQLRNEPLISPIYEQSAGKVDEICSILKSLQVQAKNKISHPSMRNLTRKLLTITKDQVSILKIYFYPWKQRLGDSCFKGDKKTPAFLLSEGKQNMVEAIALQIPEINYNLWKQLEDEIQFVYQDISEHLKTSTEQIQFNICNHTKQILAYVLKNYIESIPFYCCSLKSYVQVNTIIRGKFKNILEVIEKGCKGEEAKIKFYEDQRDKIEEKLKNLDSSMLNFMFGRLKLCFVAEVLKGKQKSKQIMHSEQFLKESYQKILNPLKQTVVSCFKLMLDDLEFLKNYYGLTLENKTEFQDVINLQIDNFIMFLANITSISFKNVSEELKTSINPDYTNRLHKSQKGHIDDAIKQLGQIQQSGCWFVVANSYLQALGSHTGKKIIESAQRYVEIPKNYDYGKTFAYIKNCTSRNLYESGNYFASLVVCEEQFKSMLKHIEALINILNVMFPDTKRSVMKKPSFLTEENGSHQTQILTAKKLHLLNRRNPTSRNSILIFFIRKVLKETLIKIRKHQNRLRQYQIYALVQICFQLTSVEDQSLIAAYYYLIRQNWGSDWELNREEADTCFNEDRREVKI